MQKYKSLSVTRFQFKQNLCKSLWDACNNSIYGIMQTRIYYCSVWLPTQPPIQSLL